MKYVTSERTKSELAEALKRLLAERSLGEITVKDIAGLCGVNRQTFYYHFLDIHALAEWMFTCESGKLVAACRECDSIEDAIVRLMEYLRVNRPAFMGLLRNRGREYIARLITDDACVAIRDYADKFLRREIDSFDQHFYAAAITQSALGWLEGGMLERPTELAKRMMKLLTKGLATNGGEPYGQSDENASGAGV